MNLLHTLAAKLVFLVALCSADNVTSVPTLDANDTSLALNGSADAITTVVTVGKISVDTMAPIYTHHTNSTQSSTHSSPDGVPTLDPLSTSDNDTKLVNASNSGATGLQAGKNSSMNTTTQPKYQLPSFIRQLATHYPELKDLLPLDQPLNDEQLQQIYDFAQQVKKGLSLVPARLRQNLTDIVEALEDSDLFDNVTKSLTEMNGKLPSQPAPTYWPYTQSWPVCSAQLMQMLIALNHTEEWALSMIDASGKPEKSILQGNLKWYGNSEQCKNVHHASSGFLPLPDVEGNICRFNLDIIPPSLNLGAISFLKPKIDWDVCLPKSCQASDLMKTLFDRNITFVNIVCTPDLDISGDSGAIVAIVILCVFGALMFAGTVMEVYLKFRSDEKDNYFIHAYANGGIANKGYEIHETQLDEQGAGSPVVSELPINGISGAIDTKFQNGGHANGAVLRNGVGLSNIPYLSEQSLKPKESENSKNKKTNDDTASLSKWQKALLAFSIPRNTGRLLGVKAGPGNIGCLHGMRVLSMGWVIFGHCLLFSAVFGNFKNARVVFELMNTFPFQFTVINATLSVDTFFFMSGILTAYLFLKQCAKRGKVTCKEFVLYYVHRYWRLTPTQMIWVMIVATLIKYVGEGRPGWYDYPAAQGCKDAWWTNLLYINNVYHDKGMCLGVTWFLSNDMQFYIIAPLVLIPWVYRQRILGFVVAGLLIATQLSSTLWLIYKYNADNLRSADKYQEKVFIKPYARVAAFAIGLIFGWILDKTKGRMKMNKCVVILGWLAAMGLAMTITMVTYDENKDPMYSVDGWPVGGKMAHEALSRPLWAFVCGWVVLACANGYGGFVNSILSWEGFLPLSRLTYGAFLIHLTVMNYDMMITDSTYLYTATFLVYRFFGYFVVAYLLSYLLAITVEAPTLGLEKVVLGGH